MTREQRLAVLRLGVESPWRLDERELARLAAYDAALQRQQAQAVARLLAETELQAGEIR